LEVPSRFEVDDALWAEVQPLLPVIERRRRYPGRKRLDDRGALNGILFVLHTGIAWRDLPVEFGLRVRRDVLAQIAGMATSRRVGAPAPSGAQAVERCRGDRLVSRRRGREPYSRAFGGLLTGPSPVDRARTGSKHHLLTDAGGLPLALTLTGGNRHDVTQLLALLDGVKAHLGKGRPSAQAPRHAVRGSRLRLREVQA
jgi:transposase